MPTPAQNAKRIDRLELQLRQLQAAVAGQLMHSSVLEELVVAVAIRANLNGEEFRDLADKRLAGMTTDAADAGRCIAAKIGERIDQFVAKDRKPLPN